MPVGTKLMQTNPFTGKNIKRPLSKSIDEKADPAQAENDFFETEEAENPLDFFLRKPGSDPAESKAKDPPGDQANSFMSSFLVELIHSIKQTLVSIKNTSIISAEKFSDGEYRNIAQRTLITLRFPVERRRVVYYEPIKNLI